MTMSSDLTPTPTDPIERAAIDRDDLGLSLAEHWHRQGIVRTYPDLSPDEFEDDDTIVFRAYLSAVDFILGRLSAAGLLAATPPQPGALRDAIAAVRESQEFEGPDAPYRPDLLEFAHRARRLASFAEFYQPASSPAPADDEAAIEHVAQRMAQATNKADEWARFPGYWRHMATVAHDEFAALAALRGKQT